MSPAYLTAKSSCVAAVAATLALASPASAATFIYSGTFSGSAEVPPNASPGTGTATVTYDDVLQTIRYQIQFSGLTGTTVAAHVHLGMGPGTNGGVATQLPSLPGFPLGLSSGSYDATFSLTDEASFNPAFVAANGGDAAGAEAALAASLASGFGYFNIHSTEFPSGEIRADLTAVPEPGTWGLMILGFGLMGFALRKTRPRVRYV